MFGNAESLLAGSKVLQEKGGGRGNEGRKRGRGKGEEERGDDGMEKEKDEQMS